MNEDMLKLEDDFALEREEFISAKVNLGEGEVKNLEMPSLVFQIEQPQLKKSPTPIENVELTRRGITGGSLF